MSTGGAYSALGSPTAVRNEFFKRLSIAEAGSWASQIAMEFSSDSESETYKWLGPVPVMRQWLGGRLEEELDLQDYTLINALYEATLAANVMDIRRDKWDQILIRARELGVRAATHWEKLITALIEANGNCYDGQAFFSALHTEGSSGLQDNDLTASITDTANPAADEVKDAIVNSLETFLTFVDGQGEPINQDVRDITLMIPPTYMGIFTEVLSNDFLAVTGGGTANNTVKALQSNGFQMRYLVNPRLTTTDRFYMFRMDGMTKPFIKQSENDVEMAMIGAGSEEEFKNNRWLWGIKASRVAGYGMWQHGIRFIWT